MFRFAMFAVLLCLPLSLLGSAALAADITGWPTAGTVDVKGVQCDYSFLMNSSGPAYYQVLVPRESGGFLPLTIGVPSGTAAGEVENYIEWKVNAALGPYPVPLPF